MSHAHATAIAADPALSVLQFLRRQGGDVSGQDMCDTLGVSRTAVWKQVQVLRHLGYRISAVPHRGYRLEEAPNAPLPTELACHLTTQCFGQTFHYLPEVDSTNRHLLGLAEAGAPEGTLVAADAQTRGRGRLDRTWFSPPARNLYLSLLLRPPVPPQQAPCLALVIGLAVIRVLKQRCPDLQPALKWPNDIYVGARKLGGVLCELRSDMDRVAYIVAGIGLNVNLTREEFPVDLRATATSILAETGQPCSRPALLAELLQELEGLYGRWCRQGLAPFLAELETHSLLQGRAVTVNVHGRTVHGTVRGIAPSGALLLETAGHHRREILSGDVHVEKF